MDGFFLMVKYVIKKKLEIVFLNSLWKGKENFCNFFFFTQTLHNSRNVKDFRGV